MLSFYHFESFFSISKRFGTLVQGCFRKYILFFWKCYLVRKNGSQNLDQSAVPNPPPTWSGKIGFLEITKNMGGVGKFWMVVAIIFYVVEFNQPQIPKKVHEQLSLAIRKPEISPFRAQNGIFITSAPDFSVADQRISESPVDSWITM